MGIFQSKSKYNIGMTKEPFEPVSLKELYERAKKKREAKKDEITV